APLLPHSRLLLSLSSHGVHRDLHSFPTRRSSDLACAVSARGAGFAVRSDPAGGRAEGAAATGGGLFHDLLAVRGRAPSFVTCRRDFRLDVTKPGGLEQIPVLHCGGGVQGDRKSTRLN